VLRRTTFFGGAPDDRGLPDVLWFRPDGRRMARRDWDAVDGGRLGVFLNGNALHTVDARGEPLHDDSFLVVFNAHHEPTTFLLPTRRFGRVWTVEVSTADGDGPIDGSELPARAPLTVDARTLVVLRRSR
jgi:glycogen operon protein